MYPIIIPVNTLPSSSIEWGFSCRTHWVACILEPGCHFSCIFQCLEKSENILRLESQTLYIAFFLELNEFQSICRNWYLLQDNKDLEGLRQKTSRTSFSLEGLSKRDPQKIGRFLVQQNCFSHFFHLVKTT